MGLCAAVVKPRQKPDAYTRRPSSGLQLGIPVGLADKMFPACFAAIDVKRKGRLGGWLNRFAQQSHPRIAYQPPSLTGIAGKAGDHAIGPAPLSTSTPGNDMVNREVLGRTFLTAILAAITVTAKEIAAGEGHPRPVKTIAALQNDDLGNSNAPADTLDEGLATGDGQVRPSVKIVEGVVLRLDNTGKTLEKHCESPANRTNLYR